MTKSLVNHLKEFVLVGGSLIVLLNQNPSHSLEKPYLEETLEIIINELRIKENYPLPKIKIVERKELQRLFKKNTSKSLKKWTEHFGVEKANAIMEQHLRDVTGFYTTGTNIIYLGDFLKGCEMKGAIGHELTHYFQNMKGDGMAPIMYTKEEIHLHKEFQAEKIEKIIYDKCLENE